MKSATAQVAYECSGQAAGAPSDKDAVSIQMQLAVPAAVAPGDAVVLRGALKMQFSEKLRTRAQLFGVDEIDAVSTTMSTYVTVAGRSVHLTADRWQSGPTPIRNPMEVSGVLRFPAFTVPAAARGGVKIQMPQNGAADTNVNNGPKKVALTVAMAISGPAAKFDAQLACYLPRTNAAVIATIPINSAGPPQTGDSEGETSGESESASAGNNTPGPTPSGPVSDPPAVPLPEIETPDTVAGSDVQGSGQSTTATGDLAQLTPSSQPARSANGTYVSASALLLGGFAVVLASLGYAALTNARIRKLQRSSGG